MGHAYLENISTFFVKRLYAKGRLSVRDCADALQKAGEQLQAAEGKYDEPYMLRMGLEDVVRFLSNAHPLPDIVDRIAELGKPAKKGKRKRKKTDDETPVIEPVDLTAEQRRILRQWERNEIDDWDCGDDGDTGEYGIFDSIEWRFGPGWRERYPEGIPTLDHVEH